MASVWSSKPPVSTESTSSEASKQPASDRSRVLAGCLALGRALQRVPRAGAALLVLGWMALIWSVSSIEYGPGNGLLGRIKFLANLGHAPEFGLLALWLVLLSPRRDGWVVVSAARAWMLWAVSLGYAVVDELHQRSVPGRDATAYDVLTDAVGAACVLWIVRYVGSSGASERGLWKRLALGVLACLLSAALAANHHHLFA